MIAAILVSSQATTFAAVTDGKELRLIDSAGTKISGLGGDWTPRAWRLDGSALCLESPGGVLGVLLPRADAKKVDPVGAGSWPAWSVRGDLIFSLPKVGIARWSAGGKVETIIPGGTLGAPSPDGNRVAFAAANGLWVANADGSQPMRIATAKLSAPPSWSLDGRWIAYAEGGAGKLIGPNGRRADSIGEFDGGVLNWSPGAPVLLGRKGADWTVWDFRDRKRTVAPVKWTGVPQWTGPLRLGGIADGKWVEWKVGEEPKASPFGDALKGGAANSGVMLGPSFPSPFATAPRLAMGTTVWRGRLLALDPIRGQMTFAVETETQGKSERVYGAPQVRTASIAERFIPVLLSELQSEAQVVLREGRVESYFSVERQRAFDLASLARSEPATGGKRPIYRTSADGWPVVPLVYPITGKHSFVDTWGAPRDGGRRKHQGNDLMAPKMTPLVAVFDGTFYEGSVRNDDGVSAVYIHINNDTPGTDDGRGGQRYAFPAGLRNGMRVRAGQVVAFCGDSGNAEETGAHLHFELHVPGFGVVNPAPSLRAATRLPRPKVVDRHPELRPQVGEVRLEGVVHNVDPKRRVLTIDLMAVQSAGKPLAPNLMPRYGYLVFPEGKELGFAGLPEVQYDFAQARPGMKVVAVGRGTASRIEVGRAELGFLD